MPMPLRPQSPVQPRYRGRMMPPQMHHGGNPYGQYNYQPQIMGQMTRSGGNKGGGLLAKILGRGNQQPSGMSGILPSMSRSAPSTGGASGILKSLANPETLNGFLNNTQNVLKTAQQLGPVIQQYGPLIRNLPSLWKLYRGLKDAGSDTEIEDVEGNSTEEAEEISINDTEFTEIAPHLEEPSSLNKKHTKRTNSTSKHVDINKQRQSTPKLYI
jgi:hypothetical protein